MGTETTWIVRFTEHDGTTADTAPFAHLWAARLYQARAERIARKRGDEHVRIDLVRVSTPVQAHPFEVVGGILGTQAPR